jgi:hypothetical protein
MPSVILYVVAAVTTLVIAVSATERRSSHGNTSAALCIPSYIGTCTTADERALAAAVNLYRTSLHPPLPSIPISASLSKVAQLHAWDLAHNNPDSGSDPRGHGACNLHSWSKCPGRWTRLCYTDDDVYVSRMLQKPSEMSAYKSPAYEIVHAAVRGVARGTAGYASALAAWKADPGVNNVITEKRPDVLNLMGVGTSGRYSVIWFGNAPDAAPSTPACR